MPSHERKSSPKQRREAERRKAQCLGAAPHVRCCHLIALRARQRVQRDALASRRSTAALARLLPLGSTPGRASWNYRVQTGGPSPAPVQRAPRRPVVVPAGTMPGAARERFARPRAGTALDRIRNAPFTSELRPCNHISDDNQDFVAVLGTINSRFVVRYSRRPSSASLPDKLTEEGHRFACCRGGSRD